MPNMAITTLGIMWIGLLGSFAALILRLLDQHRQRPAGRIEPSAPTRCSCSRSASSPTTSAPCSSARAAGRTPLRPWISPNKSVEGLIGGTLMTIVAMVMVGIGDGATPGSRRSTCSLLAIVISVMAPLGDLAESMFKRNLDIKDFGSIVKGHGGMLDRFDGFLFTLPGGVLPDHGARALDRRVGPTVARAGRCG